MLRRAAHSPIRAILLPHLRFVLIVTSLCAERPNFPHGRARSQPCDMLLQVGQANAVARLSTRIAPRTILRVWKCDMWTGTGRKYTIRSEIPLVRLYSRGQYPHMFSSEARLNEALGDVPTLRRTCFHLHDSSLRRPLSKSRREQWRS
jgi:hypothetical protein